MIYKFTNSSQKVIEIANKIAIELGHKYVGTEHLLYGLAKEKNGIANKILENQGIYEDKILVQIENLIGKVDKKIDSTLGFTPRAKKIFENAFLESKRIGADYIGTEQLLIGVLKESDSIAIKILTELNINYQKLNQEISKIIKSYDDNVNDLKKETLSNKNINSENISKYGEDLTAKAENGKIDPVIGRDKETERVIEILSRRVKNNPCLIGEPGVGKTAIVEGLAQRIIEGDIPEALKDKRVITLDITSMVAGAKYRGDFEERIKKWLNEVKNQTNMILFIDEIHTIVGAGAAEGAIDAANILKPLMARGEIQVVGATTINEYRKYIEKDSALERRFQPIMVEEPSRNDCIKILKGIRDKYEAHHEVNINDNAICSAVDLSIQYINDRFLPDKAIDLIDEASSKVRLKMFREPEMIKKIEEDLNVLYMEKEDAIKLQKFEEAAKIRDKEENLILELKREKEKWKSKKNKDIINITEEDIASVISSWTGIPVSKISETENQKLINMEENIHEKIIGQDEAVRSVVKAIKRSRAGLKDKNKPIGTFLFLGPTGVGKTEMSKVLAENLFGKQDSMIRVDMSEYMEAHSVSKLIGSPPGYIGYEEGGGITEKIRRKPYSVVLFDEIEKAHSDVMNLLLQILDEGRLTDNSGRVVDFKNSVIIMTSNVGARSITEHKTLGFKTDESNTIGHQNEEERKRVLSEVKREFKPEFLNRIDEIVVFHKLNQNDKKNIVRLMLKEVEEKLESKRITLSISDSVIEELLNTSEEVGYGGRTLKRSIQNIIENKIAEEIIEGKIKEKSHIEINTNDNKEVIIEKRFS